MGRPKSQSPEQIAAQTENLGTELERTLRDGMREVCDGCVRLRPISAFPIEEIHSEDGTVERSRRTLCEDCEGDAPPAEDPVAWELVPAKHRKLIQGVFEQKMTLQQAKEAAGYSPTTKSTVFDIVSSSPASRAALQAVLRLNGIHSLMLARELKKGMRATRAQWNPQLQTWDLFPDNSARQKNFDLAAKLLDLMPTKRHTEAPTHVEFHTNIFEAPREEVDVTASSARYVVEAERGDD